MSRTLLLPLAVLVPLLAACETRPADPHAPEPLREVRTSDDRLYIQCVAHDPLFRSEVCRAARGRVGSGNER